MQSISVRFKLAFANAWVISAKARVLRWGSLLLAAADFPDAVSTATLRLEEENSSASIFIRNAARRFAQHFDMDVAIQSARSKRGCATAKPALNPFDDHYDCRIINELLKTRPDDLAGRIE